MSGDWTADFVAVPPGPGEHDWHVSRERGDAAGCSRCGLQIRAVISQLQPGRAVSAELVLSYSGVRYVPAQHGRCTP